MDSTVDTQGSDRSLTYSEWNKRGYRIHRGQKAHGYRDGEATFTPNQVYDPTELSQAHEDYLVRAQEWEYAKF